MHPLENKVLAFIREKSLIKHGEKVLLAVSGGADSVALLTVFNEIHRCIPFTFCVAHLNHKIRKRTSNLDANFVKELAKSINVEFILKEIDVPLLAKKLKISKEMAARNARYNFLVEAAKKHKCDVIATAHTANDQAETILIRLARGSSVEGLKGIPYSYEKDAIRIIRPLLTTTRVELVDYLKDRRVIWREDETNKDISILRNKIRHKILPYLEKNLNPQLLKAFNRLASIINDEEEWLAKIIDEIANRCFKVQNCTILLINKELLALPSALQRRIIIRWLTKENISYEIIDFQFIEDLRRAISKTFSDKKERTFFLRNYTIQIGIEHTTKIPNIATPHSAAALTNKNQYFYEIKIPGSIFLPQFAIKISTSFEKQIYKMRPCGIAKYPAKASISERKRDGAPVFVRSWQYGDRMKPYGLSGYKKLQDIFTEQKIAKELRSLVPVFICRDEIIWIPGYRIADDCKVQPKEYRSLQISVSAIN